jgi:hypothetical protein
MCASSRNQSCVTRLKALVKVEAARHLASGLSDGADEEGLACANGIDSGREGFCQAPFGDDALRTALLSGKAHREVRIHCDKRIGAGRSSRISLAAVHLRHRNIENDEIGTEPLVRPLNTRWKEWIANECAFS